MDVGPNAHPGLINCTMYGNIAPVGSGVSCPNDYSISIENTIISGGHDGEAVNCGEFANVTLTCCDLHGNAGGDWVGCIADQAWVNGNISADPIFCDAPNSDFALRSDSPCLPENHPGGLGCGVIGVLGLGCFAAEPIITSIDDVGNDQGGQVRLIWHRSLFDASGDTVDISGYGIYRREDDFKCGFGAQKDGVGLGMANSALARLDGWDYLDTVPARGDSVYQYVAPTLCDSTIVGGICWSVFFVSAMTPNPLVYFDSPPDSGYSVDNLVPGVPIGFVLSYSSNGNQLGWEESEEVDFAYFRVYRSTEPDFDPGPENLIQSTVGTSWFDSVSNPWDWYYKITTVDFAGNESDPATPLEVSGVSGSVLPSAFALHYNRPNPFNPRTIIQFDLPEPTVVSLGVYDISGRLVRVLLCGEAVVAGRHEAVWNGRNESGRTVAAGVYFYRLEGGSFSETRRMTLVK